MAEQKTILVAEDEVDLREALADMLELEEFTVIQVGDGEAAVATAIETQPDLLLLDVMMPKKSGLEALGEIRHDSWGQSVPVIILTALSDMASVSEAIEKGGVNTEYLVKTDWKLEAVVGKVKEKLGL